MTTYYYKYPVGHGKLEAENDEQAISMVRDNVFLYKESNTKNGLPFITVKDNYKD